MSSKWLIIIPVLLLLLAGCGKSSTPDVLVDVPEKPTVIRVGITPALAHLEDVFANYSCAAEVETLAEIQPWLTLQSENKDVFLVYGEGDKELSEFVYQIGESSLVFIVNPDLPVSELKVEQVQAIFNGTLTDWNLENPLSSYMGAIQLWGYMEDTEIMQYALDSIGLVNPTGQWNVVPSPKDVVDMVAQDQNAMGIVPAYAVTNDVVVLSVSDVEFQPVPILAVWTHNPNTTEQDWLLCVQGALK